MSTEGGTRAIYAALGANLGIAVTKFLAFFLTGSSSMLAEGVHSVADSANQVLLLFGGRRAKRQATPEHPFGYGRERYFWAFVVSIVLFSVGGLFALYEAYHKWEHPEGIEEWVWVPFVVLVVSIALEGNSFRTAVQESNHTRGSRRWSQFIKSSKAPELPVILLEDFAALVGLVLALFGVILTVVTGNGRWDAVGTGLIGVLLVAVAITLAVEMKSLLLGEAASVEHVRSIERAITGTDGVDRLIHMRTLHVGPEELIVAAKVAVTETDTGDVIADTINIAELNARQAVPELTLLMYLEPDIDHGVEPERPTWDPDAPEAAVPAAAAPATDGPTAAAGEPSP